MKRFFLILSLILIQFNYCQAYIPKCITYNGITYEQFLSKINYSISSISYQTSKYNEIYAKITLNNNIDLYTYLCDSNGNTLKSINDTNMHYVQFIIFTADNINSDNPYVHKDAYTRLIESIYYILTILGHDSYTSYEPFNNFYYEYKRMCDASPDTWMGKIEVSCPIADNQIDFLISATKNKKEITVFRVNKKGLI